VAPGRYEGSFAPTQQGVFLLRVTGQPPVPDEPGIAEIAGWALDYSPEYRQLQPDPDTLVRLAVQAGGRVAASDPAQVFAHTLQAPGTFWPAWPALLALAAVLLPLDIALRRLVVTRSDILRFAQALERWVRLRTTIPQTAPEQQATLRSLLRLKQNVGEQLDKSTAGVNQQVAPVGLSPALPSKSSDSPKLGESAAIRPESPSTHKPPESPPQEIGETDQTAASAVNTLLKRKRLRRDQEKPGS
jgi:hypothetical protein